jgi:hypothetical protein
MALPGLCHRGVLRPHLARIPIASPNVCEAKPVRTRALVTSLQSLARTEPSTRQLQGHRNRLLVQAAAVQGLLRRWSSRRPAPRRRCKPGATLKPRRPAARPKVVSGNIRWNQGARGRIWRTFLIRACITDEACTGVRADRECEAALRHTTNARRLQGLGRGSVGFRAPRGSCLPSYVDAITQ